MTSRLDAAPDRVWAHASSMAGVNHELSPWMRMTHPAGMESLDSQEVPLGTTLFRSVILAFGFVPVDLHALALASIDKGRGFSERSHTLTQRAWHHDRTIDAIKGGGCTVTDRVSFWPRVPGMGVILAPMLRHVFANRHRKLVAMFGGEVGTVEAA